MAAELEVSPSHLSRVLRDEKEAGLAMRRAARDRYGIPLQWWDELALPDAPVLADALTDEVTPAEAPAPKRLSSRPPPMLADATEDEDTTRRDIEPPPRVARRLQREREDTDPDPRAGEELVPTPKPLTVLDVRTDTPSPDGDA
jgi:hypothetical protein